MQADITEEQAWLVSGDIIFDAPDPPDAPVMDGGAISGEYLGPFVSALGIAAHNLFSCACTVSAQYWDGAAWVTVATHSPSRDTEAIMLVWAPVRAARWRMLIEGTATPAIGYASLGLALEVQGGVLPGYRPLYMSQKVESRVPRSVGGAKLVSYVSREGILTDLSFAPVEREWAATSFDPFRQHFNDGNGFFLAPTPVMSLRDVALCWREGEEIGPVHDIFGEYFTFQMGVRAHG
jgi:hypothetical protein